MTDDRSRLARRPFLVGIAAALGTAGVRNAHAQDKNAPRPALSLKATTTSAALRDNAPATPIWALQSSPDAARFKRGDDIAIAFANGLPVASILTLRGLDGAADPLTARPAVPAGGSGAFSVVARQAGTFTLDARLLGDGTASASAMRPLVVAEADPVVVDHDDVLLIEDWRLRPDGSAAAPGVDPADAAAPVYTINQKPAFEVTARVNDRLRFRLINGCQRSVISIKIDDHDVRVMALDSQPSEPFLARGGQLVLAPGTRIDALIDAVRPAGSVAQILLHDGVAARPIGRIVMSADPPRRPAPLPEAQPLPSHDLPVTLDLKGAQRVDLDLGATPAWTAPARWAPETAPVLTARRGRTVVLALINRTASPTIFRLGGHHARLLDRLDDGWKPFWLDTVAVGPQQTQRIAFAAAHPGRWLMESVGTDWASPRLVRWFSVE